MNSNLEKIRTEILTKTDGLSCEFLEKKISNCKSKIAAAREEIQKMAEESSAEIQDRKISYWELMMALKKAGLDLRNKEARTIIARSLDAEYLLSLEDDFFEKLYAPTKPSDEKYDLEMAAKNAFWIETEKIGSMKEFRASIMSKRNIQPEELEKFRSILYDKDFVEEMTLVEQFFFRTFQIWLFAHNRTHKIPLCEAVIANLADKDSEIRSSKTELGFHNEDWDKFKSADDNLIKDAIDHGVGFGWKDVRFLKGNPEDKTIMCTVNSLANGCPVIMIYNEKTGDRGIAHFPADTNFMPPVLYLLDRFKESSVTFSEDEVVIYITGGGGQIKEYSTLTIPSVIRALRTHDKKFKIRTNLVRKENYGASYFFSSDGTIRELNENQLEESNPSLLERLFEKFRN